MHDSGVPYLFVTNNGMDTEAERAKILTKQFDIPVTTKNMVLNHSALQVGLVFAGADLKARAGEAGPAVSGLAGLDLMQASQLVPLIKCI